MHYNLKTMKKFCNSFVSILALLFTLDSINAQNTQIIRGVIFDKQSQFNLPGANVLILNSEPIKGATSDANGKFKINNVLPGRYDLKITFMGYKEVILSSIVVTTGKEVV